MSADYKLKDSKSNSKRNSKLSISPEKKNKKDFNIEEILQTVFNKHS